MNEAYQKMVEIYDYNATRSLMISRGAAIIDILKERAEFMKGIALQVHAEYSPLPITKNTWEEN